MELEPNPPVSVEPSQPSPVTETTPATHRGHIWPWLIVLLVPIIAFILLSMTSHFGTTYDDPFYAFYINQIIQALLLAALGPAILAHLLHIPGMAVSVAGFGFPSPLGILVSAISWMFVGKGLYAIYHSHLRVIFWFILIGSFITLLISGYIMTSDYRALAGAKMTGSTAPCANLEGEIKGYCLIEAAKSLNDPSICEQIPGWQRTACYRQLGASYSPLPGMK